MELGIHLFFSPVHMVSEWAIHAMQDYAHATCLILLWDVHTSSIIHDLEFGTTYVPPAQAGVHHIAQYIYLQWAPIKIKHACTSELQWVHGWQLKLLIFT